MVAATLAAATPAAAASPDALAAQRAAAWLETQSISTGGQRADLIVALAAAGRAPSTLQPRLASLVAIAPGYATTAGAAGKVALAAVAAGRDPRALAGVDYVARIKSTYHKGRYGTTAYDQAYAMLALRAAGEPLPGGAVRVLRRTRRSGGWSFSVAVGSDDVSATGLLIEASRASGVSASDPMLRGAGAWLLSQHNGSGGFAISGRGPTEANSTAIAICALRALGRTPATATRRALRSLQEGDGGFRFTRRVRESRLFATVDALLALSGRSLPPPY